MEDGNFHNFFELFLLVATLNPVYFVALLRRSYSQMRDLHKNGNSFAFAKQGGGVPLDQNNAFIA